MAESVAAASLEQAAQMDRFAFRGASCDVTAVVRSRIAVVTFDNLASIDERPDRRPWPPWLDARIGDLGHSIIGLQSHAKDWYRTPEPSEHIRTLVSHGFFERFDRVLFVGASMGGFAALCFAGLVPDARVLAFSPQSTLNRRIAPFERRYPWPHRKFDWDSPAYLDAADHVGGIAGGHIFFDPHVIEDKLHANRLVTSTVQPVKIPFADHTLIRTVAKSGALPHLLRRLAEHDSIDPEFWQLMRNRRDDLQWSKQFLRQVAARGDGPLARQACTKVWQTQGFPIARRIRRELKTATKTHRALTKTRKADQPFWTDELTEAEVRQQLPVFVNSYNQLSYLRDTVDWFARHGFGNVTVLDNQSSYPPLLDYFSSDAFNKKAKLQVLEGNLGPRKALAHAASDPATDRGFIFTDPDLELPEPPAPEMIKTMVEMGLRHDYVKVGLALSLDPSRVDLDRVTYKTRTVAQVEAKYWKNEVEQGVAIATTDTTFFMYVPRGSDGCRFNDYGPRQPRIPSVRIGRKGFVAVHRPWLFHDTVDPAEEQYYFDVTKGHSTYVMAQKAATETG